MPKGGDARFSLTDDERLAWLLGEKMSGDYTIPYVGSVLTNASTTSNLIYTTANTGGTITTYPTFIMNDADFIVAEPEKPKRAAPKPKPEGLDWVRAMVDDVVALGYA